MRLRWLWIALGLGVIAVVRGEWSRVSERRFRRELLEANREMANGLHQLARQHLSILTVKRPDDPEAAYQLSLCEEILGHFNSAEAVCQNESVVYLHNQTRRESTGHFLMLRLEGSQSNRDGVGASVTVQCGECQWVAPQALR
jgi:hypothetical protein